ncbi:MULTISPECIES: helix-turn-helix domain-containing protein [Kocuria]
MTTTPQDQRDNPVAHHVSDEVRAWLGRKRRTQSDLARHMGIAKSAVSVRLNGSREFSISELVEIAAWLDISLADLLGPELLQARRSPRSDRVAAGAGEKEWALWGSNPRPMD